MDRARPIEIANIHEAKTPLSRLVREAQTGNEVFGARAGEPLSRLVPTEPLPEKRRLGMDVGKARIADDLDAPMPELEPTFYGEGVESARDPSR